MYNVASIIENDINQHIVHCIAIMIANYNANNVCGNTFNDIAHNEHIGHIVQSNNTLYVLSNIAIIIAMDQIADGVTGANRPSRGRAATVTVR
jgi:hypothetical protein